MVEKHFDSIETSREWLSTIVLAEGDEIIVTVTSAAERSPATRRKFSETALAGV